MLSAEMTAAVWARLLAARSGEARAPAADFSPGEAAAWDLYAPLAAARGSFWFAQVGQSLDGRIATVSGDARDVSGLGGLRHLHRCRALAEAVVVGVRTALGDDPRLTVRLAAGPNPARVVVDPKGRLPDDAALFAVDGARRIVVQAVPRPRPAGVEVVQLPATDGWIAPLAIRAALQRLGLRTTPIARLSDALRPETRVYSLETEVVFDCALAPRAGSASRSQCPTSQAVDRQAARRA